MRTICPKCDHVRADDSPVPATECPACGVIYAKAVRRTAVPEARPVIYADRPALRGGTGKWVAIAAIALGAFLGWRHHHDRAMDAATAVADGEIDPDADAIPTDALRAFAARVKAQDVVMYSTTECVYCGQAKGWLNANGFAFTECNMSVDAHCITEFRAHGGNGTPFLNVRGRFMREGFDAHQFLRILKDTDARA